MVMIAVALKMGFYVKSNIVSIEAKSVESLESVLAVFKGQMKGMKSVEFKIWITAYRK